MYYLFKLIKDINQLLRGCFQFNCTRRFCCKFRNSSRSSRTSARITHSLFRPQTFSDKNMIASSICKVCDTKNKKYTCPSCRIPYCSLECWKVHKTTECQPPPKEEACIPEGAVLPPPREPYRYPTEDTVPIDKLQMLGDSAGLRQVLDNPHVRDILRAIDQSENPRASIQAAMQEPIFVEFAEECLKIVEPNEDVPQLH